MAFEFLKGMFNNSNGAGGELLLPADQFRTLILHECARCDRNSHAFSLIHIDLRGNSNNSSLSGKQLLRQLSRTLVRRMRTTDEIGWMDEHSIGVFLPETDADGARSFALDAFDGYSYQIFTYPWLGNINDNTGGGHRRDSDAGGNRGYGSRNAEGRAKQGEQLTLHNQAEGSLEDLILPDRLPFWKRVYDIIGSSVLLAVFSPVFAVVAIYIKIVSPGPVFFRQERVGYLGRSFTMIKFRTMKLESDNISIHKDYLKDLINSDGKAMTKLDTGKDDRLIPLAGILRRSCIDELPQLINVFRGDMSLVGPRPCLDYEAREFALWQRRRFHTVPGITGLWQVSGKNRLTFKEMVRLDIRYASKKNVVIDLLISLKTVPAILGQVRDAMHSKIADKPGKSKARVSRKWSLNDLVRQMFL